MKIRFFVSSILFILFFQHEVCANATYIVGRAPQISALTLVKDWAPFVEYLTQQTGHQFQLKVYESRAKFENDLKSGVFDFFYGNPGYLVVSHLRHGYTPLLRSSKKKLTGIIVTRSDSQYTSPRELSNVTLAFPDESAFAASLYVRSILEEYFSLEFKPQYVGGHDNVYRAVAAGRYVAGGGARRTLEREPKQLQSKLKIIYETPGMAPHPLSVHPRVPEQVSKAVVNAVLRLQVVENGKLILKKIKLQQPITTSYEQDYQVIENFAVEMYKDLLN